MTLYTNYIVCRHGIAQLALPMVGCGVPSVPLGADSIDVSAAILSFGRTPFYHAHVTMSMPCLALIMRVDLALDTLLFSIRIYYCRLLPFGLKLACPTLHLNASSTINLNEQ